MWRLLTVWGALCTVISSLLPGAAWIESVAWFASVSLTLLATAMSLDSRSRAGIQVAAELPDRGRVKRAAAAVASLAGAGLAGWVLVGELRAGLADPAASVFMAGALTVAVGGVGAALRKSDPTNLATPTWRRRWVPAATLAVAVAALATATPWATARLAVDATTAAPTSAIPATPQLPTGIRWSWQPSDRVVGAVRAGPGVVIATADGRLTALDGVTGRARWHYGLWGTRVVGLAATADGTTVLAVHARHANTSDDAPQQLVVFDAATGAVHWQRRLGARGAFRSSRWNLTPSLHTLPTVDYQAERIAGYDLISGTRRWAWSPPKECRFDGPKEITSAADTVVVLTNCASGSSDQPPADPAGRRYELVAFGLDDRSGALLWRRVLAGGDPQVLGDAMTATTDGRRLLAPVPGQVLDARTGVTQTTVPTDNRTEVDVGSLPVVLPPSGWASGSGGATIPADVLGPGEQSRTEIDLHLPGCRPQFSWFLAAGTATPSNTWVTRRFAGLATTDRAVVTMHRDSDHHLVVAVHDLRSPGAPARVLPLRGHWASVAPTNTGQLWENGAVAVLPAPGAVVLARLGPDPLEKPQPVIGLM